MQSKELSAAAFEIILQSLQNSLLIEGGIHLLAQLPALHLSYESVDMNLGVVVGLINKKQGVKVEPNPQHTTTMLFQGL